MAAKRLALECIIAAAPLGHYLGDSPHIRAWTARNIMAGNVHDNADKSRYELEVDGHLAIAVYRLAPGVITFVHTEVPPELGGKGIGSALVKGALEDVRRRGLKVVVRCSFVRGYMTKHPEFNDLLAPA